MEKGSCDATQKEKKSPSSFLEREEEVNRYYLLEVLAKKKSIEFQEFNCTNNFLFWIGERIHHHGMTGRWWRGGGRLRQPNPEFGLREPALLIVIDNCFFFGLALAGIELHRG